MNNNGLLNKVITVTSKEEKSVNGKLVLKLKDEKGLTYSVWKFKQDGTESVAWGQIPDLNTATQIGYVEETKNDPTYGATTYRTIRNFNPDLANTTPDQEKPHSVANTAPQGQSDAFGRRLTLYGMVNGRLAAGSSIEAISAELPSLALLADEIDVVANRPASMNLAQTKIQENLLVIQQEEVDIDDIPFN